MVAEAFHNSEFFFFRLPNKQPDVAYDILEIYVNTCFEAMGLDHKMFHLSKETAIMNIEPVGEFEKIVDNYVISSLGDILHHIKHSGSQESVFQVSYKTAQFEPNLVEKVVREKIVPSGDAYFLPYRAFFPNPGQEKVLVGERLDEVRVFGVVPKQETFGGFIDKYLGPAIKSINEGLSNTYISGFELESGINFSMIKISVSSYPKTDPPSYIF